MERKIGEIFKHNGEWYQCANAMFNCADCHIKGGCSDMAIGACSEYSRTDGMNVVFKKLKKVGKPFTQLHHPTGKYIQLQEYKLFNPHAFLKDKVCTNHYFGLHCNFFAEIDQNTEDMNTNEKTITVPNGYEFSHVDEKGNIVLKEKKKKMPKTFGECWDMIETGNLSNFSIDTTVPDDMVKPMRALCQLLVCRNAWWKQLGWKADYKDRTMEKCVIRCCSGNIITNISYQSNAVLSFPTTEVRNEFLDTFRGLIEEAKELL